MKINKKNRNAYLACVYIRYFLPTVSLLAIFGMLFLPAHRFVFSAEVGDKISVAKLLLNSWNQSRNVLFGTESYSDGEMIFARALFITVIVLAVLYIFSLVISIWSAFVAFKFFLSDDEEGAEKQRRIFCAFIPNRIVLCLCTVFGLAIAALPYIMTPIYGLTQIENVTAVLEPPYLDSLIVGGALLLITFVLSAVSAPIERALSADLFEKEVKKDVDAAKDDYEDEYESIKTSSKNSANENARIRELFSDKKKDDK